MKLAVDKEVVIFDSIYKILSLFQTQNAFSALESFYFAFLHYLHLTVWGFLPLVVDVFSSQTFFQTTVYLCGYMSLQQTLKGHFSFLPLLHVQLYAQKKLLCRFAAHSLITADVAGFLLFWCTGWWPENCSAQKVLGSFEKYVPWGLGHVVCQQRVTWGMEVSLDP